MVGGATGDPNLTKLLEASDMTLTELSRWVHSQYPSVRDLTLSELSRYKAKDPICGWVVPFDYQDDRFNLQLVIFRDFPWTRPRVYCPEKFQYKQSPHIEKDGALCLYPPEAAHDPLNPKGLIWDAVKEAARLIVASFNEAFLNEFISEFNSYWGKTEGGKNVVSLLSPGGTSRTVSLWRSRGNYYLGDDTTVLKRWLRNRFPGNTKDYKFATATHVVLHRPILPSEYPRSGAAVLDFVRKLAPEAVELLADAAENADDKFTVSFEGRTDDGPVFFAVEIKRPTKQGIPASRRPDMLQKGFRIGKVPTTVRSLRQFGANKVEQHEIVRGDTSWVHGRDSPALRPLFDKRILMVGAGSLGSEVALLLAKTGVGSISLVDPEILDYPNVGRHVLGGSEVGIYKARSLAAKLSRDFPHKVSVEHFDQDWLSLFQKRPEVLQSVDLIVSTVGSWLAEGRLNHVARNERKLPPVLYGWAEPFSVAGHAVLIGSTGPCFACGLDQYGTPLRKVCDWEKETTRKQPHCGASFQPYGPISLSGVAALVAKTATKALLGEVLPGTEVVYWASEEEISEQGGRFNADFVSGFSVKPKFGGSRQYEFRQKKGCAHCVKE
jgi:molybdopterin/thiamine biosynthesis adenylyltransferase